MRRNRMTLALALMFIPCAAAAREKDGPSVPTVKAGTLTCTIKSEPTCERGKVPDVKVEIANRTGRDIYLVGSLDASDCKWRYPHCYFEITGPDGRSPVRGFERCGNMNGLREKDFVAVRAGGTFDPFQSIDGAGFFPAHQIGALASVPEGEYRVRFVYSTENDSITKWRGDDSPDTRLRKLFKQVPKVTVKSEEITIRVVAPKK